MLNWATIKLENPWIGCLLLSCYSIRRAMGPQGLLIGILFFLRDGESLVVVVGQFGFLRYAVFGELSSPVIGVVSGYKKSLGLNRVGGFR